MYRRAFCSRLEIFIILLLGFVQVITTYDTLASDFLASGGEELLGAESEVAGAKRKRRHGVMSLGWHRVVLDEAHTIRNSKTRKHKVRVALSQPSIAETKDERRFESSMGSHARMPS